MSLYTIPPGVSFVDALARGLLQENASDPATLSHATILLPTRRACRALQEAFLRAAAGPALILPRLMPLGDLDADELLLVADEGTGGVGAAELPPAMPALRRQLLLAQLIQRWDQMRRPAREQALGEDQAVRLAAELARLLDQIETEGLDFAKLDELVPEAYAEHWQVTLGFLRILSEHWPAIQESEGCIGPADYRNRLLAAQAEAWRRAPPQHPVIAAGSTGSIPATAKLLGLVAGLPQGRVILPGLDCAANTVAWAAIQDDPSHPQHGMAVLLQRLGMTRDQVAPWPGCGLPATPELRARAVNAALSPSAAPAWRDFAGQTQTRDLAQALEGVARIDCPGPGEEAAVIALILRQALEEEGQRAALVTPDRGLARRVGAVLRRWGIDVDDSAGTPLSHSPPGSYLRLIAEMAASGLAPLALLATLKHPLAAGGQAPVAFRAQVRVLERALLRGPRPAAGFAGLKRALRGVEKRAGGKRGGEKHAGLREWLSGLERIAAPLIKILRRGGSLTQILDAHLACAEALAASDEESGPARLWAGDAGAAAADFIAELREAAAGMPRLTGTHYPAFLASLLAVRPLRPRYGSHPRLAIWGPLEARLQQTDLLILGGLNEGAWPAEVDPGPWLSRPMCGDFGLPLPERRIGLAAHDFAQAFSAPRVYLTRATRIEGAPSVPSRWLMRLDALLQAVGLKDALTKDAARWLGWAQALDRPARTLPAEPPAPRPPLNARPRKLSVTRIEIWMRDPYDLYAREILKLRPLEPIDADPGAAELGTLVHAALERFVEAYPEALPDDPEAALLDIGAAVFAPEQVKPGVYAFWWPRFRRIARWFCEQERARRAELIRSFGEVTGELDLDAPGGSFTLTAKADRIDLLNDGSLVILDYKTGTLPRGKDTDLGFSPQLPLEAAIALGGGFAGLPTGPVARLEYWRLTGGGGAGGERAGEIRALAKDPMVRAADALPGLQGLIAEFDNPQTPYLARPRPAWARRFSDYQHLARVKEWTSGGSGEEGA